MTGRSPSIGDAPEKRLALGGAQFGLDYGVSNSAGKLGEDEARRLMRTAWDAGVDMLDLAPAYGDAEQAAAAARPEGAAFRIVSKTLVGGAAIEVVERQARRSAELAGGPLDALLVHHAAELQGARGQALWSMMRRLREQGVVRRIGFSAYVEDGPVDLARRFQPEVMQLPASYLDQRLVRSGDLAELKRMGVEIHLRSVFLQGLIFLSSERLPPKLAPIAGRLAEIRAAIDGAGATPLQAALSFALSLPEVDRLVIGAASQQDFAETLAALKQPATELDWSALALEAEWALSPVNWS